MAEHARASLKRIEKRSNIRKDELKILVAEDNVINVRIDRFPLHGLSMVLLSVLNEMFSVFRSLYFCDSVHSKK